MGPGFESPEVHQPAVPAPKRGVSEKCNSIISNISFHGRNKYANMSVAELETHFAAALAEGGINE